MLPRHLPSGGSAGWARSSSPGSPKAATAAATAAAPLSPSAGRGGRAPSLLFPLLLPPLSPRSPSRSGQTPPLPRTAPGSSRRFRPLSPLTPASTRRCSRAGASPTPRCRASGRPNPAKLLQCTPLILIPQPRPAFHLTRYSGRGRPLSPGTTRTPTTSSTSATAPSGDQSFGGEAVVGVGGGASPPEARGAGGGRRIGRRPCGRPPAGSRVPAAG